MKKEEIIELIKTQLANVLGMDVDDIDDNVSFYKLGVTSVQALKVVNRVRKSLTVDVNPVAMFEYKCVEELADYLVEVVNE